MSWISEKFGVQVGCYRGPYLDAVSHEEVEVYHVALRHSCDTWDIAEGRTREEASAELGAFIEELRLALEELQRRPLGDRDDERPRSFP